MNKRLACGLSIALALGLVLGGCGKKSEKEGQTTVKVGNVEARVKDENSTASIPLPQNMPAYAAVYPGADVKAVVTVNQAETGTMISYTTSAKPDDIIAFYKKNAEAASLESVNEIRMQGAWQFSAQSKDAKSIITVTISTENGMQAVQEVYK